MKEPMDENRLLGTDEVERYRRYLKQEERAPATISKYLHDIRLFLEYRGGTGKKTKERAAKRLNLQASAGPEPRPVSREEVLAFKEQLVQCYQPRSVNSMLAALNSFFTFGICLPGHFMRPRRTSCGWQISWGTAALRPQGSIRLHRGRSAGGRLKNWGWCSGSGGGVSEGLPARIKREKSDRA